MDSSVQPYSPIAIRLPSGLHKVVKIVPNTQLSLGKFGSFNTNALLERPFYLTYEILEKSGSSSGSTLRVVSAEELHADVVFDESSSAEARDEAPAAADGTEVVEQDGQIVVRNNRQTVDDPTRQTLSMEEIEDLKKSAVSSGKDIVTKIMESHSAIGEKTAFSLAKYIVRKAKKYMKRFTVLPLDVSLLAEWMVLERESNKVLDVRQETLGLVASWSNVHHSIPPSPSVLEQTPDHKVGRWLVVEDAAGLFVAMLAERMGLLYPNSASQSSQQMGHDQLAAQIEEKFEDEDEENDVSGAKPLGTKRDRSEDTMDADQTQQSLNGDAPRKRHRPAPDPKPAQHNSITMVHSATQPNLSMLTYFNYDPNTATSNVSTPAHEHPLHNNLKTLSWLQLLAPEDDSAYLEPEELAEEELQKLKSAKRGAYYRKRRRWERARQTVDETRAGGFDGLVVATAMELTLVMHHLVTLLRGGAPIVVYSPQSEPLVELADAYSSPRKTAFITALRGDDDDGGRPPRVPSDDFPLDPRLVLAPTLQTARAREWQVLPGRTHPLMTSPGGPEGYVFTGTRVIPSEDQAEARGVFAKKKRKVEDTNGAASPVPATA